MLKRTVDRIARSDVLFRLKDKLLSVRPRTRFFDFALSPEELATRVSDSPGPIEQAFLSHKGRAASKWIHYLPIYDRLFGPYLNKPVTMLEIGVFKGGSLEIWRKCFGPEATLYGIDIDPDCADVVDPPNQVRIGSQADPEFLSRVVAETGPLDIVLDDGSHAVEHQLASFRALWPHVKPGGLYVVEDMHSSYWTWLSWERHKGGYRRPGTGIEMAKALIDDMHGWYHGRPYRFAQREEVGAVLTFDSIVAIEKVQRPQPGHFFVGAEGTQNHW